jgi:hypothetical protein
MERMMRMTAMSRSEKVKEIISEEISHWVQLQSKADMEGRYHMGLAVSLLMRWAGKPELITPDKLRTEYKNQRHRANTAELPDAKLDTDARKRAAYACDMVERLGKLIIKIDTM